MHSELFLPRVRMHISSDPISSPGEVYPLGEHRIVRIWIIFCHVYTSNFSLPCKPCTQAQVYYVRWLRYLRWREAAQSFTNSFSNLMKILSELFKQLHLPFLDTFESFQSHTYLASRLVLLCRCFSKLRYGCQ